MKLPAIVQDIADVIGRERALYLIGQLPKCYTEETRGGRHGSAGKSERVVLYVPKVMKPDHYLVRILGWNDAMKMRGAFGGEVLCPGNCRDVYRVHRDEGIRLVHSQGISITLIAEWFAMTDRRVRQVLEIPQVERPVAANDNAPIRNGRRAANGRQGHNDD